LFAIGCVLLFATSYVILSIYSCILFVVRCGKGIYPALLGMCNGCVIRSIIGFDVGGPPFIFGLSTVGLGNVG
jgi:hypothetical protein